MSTLRKFGPYGGPGGNAWDIDSPTKKVVCVQIWSVDAFEGGVINALGFSYVDDAGEILQSGPWGTMTGEHHVINLIEDEHMISVSATTDGQSVTSLKFVTDKAEYGPYGAWSEAGLCTFSFPGTILNFVGRYSDKINAIGVYALLAP